MQPLVIRNSRLLYGGLVAVGALLFLSSLLTERTLGLVGAVLLVVAGVAGLINPAVRVEPDQVRVCNPLGMTLRRYPVTSPADLRLDGKRLLHVPTGRKVLTLGFGYDAGDVEALRAQVGGAAPR